MSERLSPLPMTTIVTTDLIGVTRGRSFPTDELDAYQVAGCGWVPANSALTPQDIIAASNPWGAYGDLRLIPDLSSRVTINNGPDADAPALDFIHGDIRETDGRPWGACPRTLLRNEVARYRDELGLQVNAAFEHEFNLDSGATEHLAFSLEAQRQGAEFGGWLLSALRAGGVEPEMFLPEYGKHQYEITCRPALGVAAADRAVNVREITREIARQMGLSLSFAPKTAEHAVCNGVHLHVSLQDMAGQPVMYDAGTANGLSTLGQHWAAGVLHYLPALCAFTAPTPVSYERLQPHHWSASYACLGQRNREAALRICPTVSLGGKSAAMQYNLEFRAMDATASPHLAMAALLIAGRLGIEQRLALNAITDEIPDSLNEEQRHARGIVALPASLSRALDCLRNSEALIEALPSALLDTYFALKTEELTLTEQLSPADLCEHYARLY
ncbi:MULTISPECIES: glutamine synthetase family protein [Pseudomonas]|uniref:glutamine synthetase family protein n=1 Tax=Pseudomonas TaxID=286 RepID=UPI000B35C63B|nr:MULTISPECIES: glutamine synthetase family protein [Pseudomonas]PMY51674.1 glutamine synthetase [Pseudomonas sp. FW305-53]PMY85504.1 glutamine synthetase [Pseudomonas sp. FW303-C2]PMY89905.1 glutamine synthetase [Pseudomonas sp. FW305-62]PNA42324.1 glutamine synthetase [Pseudomonas sp. FW306-2-2C-A10BC]PNB18911.1 glutamine synthetase [Pseudomonas sp. FW305-67]